MTISLGVFRNILCNKRFIVFRWKLALKSRLLHAWRQTIQIKRTRHAGHCWRSRDELISDVLLWTPTYGRAKGGRPYIQQLCEDTGCSPEDLPEAINDREKWRGRVRDIRAGGTTWWWYKICLIGSTGTLFIWHVLYKIILQTIRVKCLSSNFIGNFTDEKNHLVISFMTS